MNTLNNLKVHGAFTLVVQDSEGVTQVMHKDNLVVDIGFDFIADCLGKPTSRPGVMSHIAIGTGTTAAVAGDIGLESQLSIHPATYVHTPGTKTFTMSATVTSTTAAVTEAGIFNAASSGIMFDRVVFPVQNITASDTLTAIFTITLS